MRVVVTGGAGFLGSHVVDLLMRRGDEVVVLDDLSSGSTANVAHHLDDTRFEFRQVDVSDAIEVDGPVDAVMHLASPASPPDYLRRPIDTLKVGAYGTHNALDLALAAGARFLLASTSEVYGDPDVHPQPESYWGRVNPIGPRSVYDEAKRFGEAITMAYHRHHGVDTRIVRIFNTYGPRMSPADGRVVTNLVGQALRGEPLTLYGDGTQTRSFGYVGDTAAGLVALLDCDPSTPGVHDPVNIGNTGEFTVAELADLVVELVEGDHVVEYLPLPEDDPKQRRPDISRARALLGWAPRVPLAEGLRYTIDDLRTKLSTEAVER